jgi:hypothetical protein
MTEELDVEELRSELETIKDAMGIQERYPSQFHLWLVYGVLVALAAFGSQVVVLFDLPWWGHWLAWGGLLALGSAYQAVGLDDHSSQGSDQAKPSISFIYVAIFGYAIILLTIVAPLIDGAAPAVASSTIFAVFVGAVGLAYLVAGNVLSAYYIRKRDRQTFYVGGVWMLVLAGVIPQVGVLQTWGYAVFGIAFGIHAIISYIVLTRA